ncbi:hypothetical protein NHE_0926 [Neorickettsia helminthoeca str. Oregon]|uniref:Uncharacterized protein n=1 Tax=Neorickettsia helminthoeca str. Oregon TaxID=1286528 RepID=X5HMW6_9RICK|nr:hypothetical protein NHE_0926 [Neorickettsia helminthoeca str. Oregon]
MTSTNRISYPDEECIRGTKILYRRILRFFYDSFKFYFRQRKL